MTYKYICDIRIILMYKLCYVLVIVSGVPSGMVYEITYVIRVVYAYDKFDNKL